MEMSRTCRIEILFTIKLICPLEGGKTVIETKQKTPSSKQWKSLEGFLRGQQIICKLRFHRM